MTAHRRVRKTDVVTNLLVAFELLCCIRIDVASWPTAKTKYIEGVELVALLHLVASALVLWYMHGHRILLWIVLSTASTRKAEVVFGWNVRVIADW